MKMALELKNPKMVDSITYRLWDQDYLLRWTSEDPGELTLMEAIEAFGPCTGTVDFQGGRRWSGRLSVVDGEIEAIEVYEFLMAIENWPPKPFLPPAE